MKIPHTEIPVIEVPFVGHCRLFIKREDLIHEKISGNKFWKLLYNINEYREKKVENRLIVTFGGAFSNHIAAVAAVAAEEGIPALGIIRGEELQNTFSDNPTLLQAYVSGMRFRFVTRVEYRSKALLTAVLQAEFPEALIIPEGGTNAAAVNGIRHMLPERAGEFDYICAAAGTGGTIAGLSKFALENTEVLGFSVVRDTSLDAAIVKLSGRKNFRIMDASEDGYGKISDDTVRFINKFYQQHNVPLDPIYTGKMMRKIFEMAEQNYFRKNAKILAFHTGGLQGIAGANKLLRKHNRPTIDFNY